MNEITPEVLDLITQTFQRLKEDVERAQSYTFEMVSISTTNYKMIWSKREE